MTKKEKTCYLYDEDKKRAELAKKLAENEWEMEISSEPYGADVVERLESLEKKVEDLQEKNETLQRRYHKAFSSLIKGKDHDGVEKRSHPWGEFLNARLNAIQYFSEQGKSNAEIADILSCDTCQIKCIKMACNIQGGEEEND